MKVIKEIEQQYMKDRLPEFSVGDTVDVHVKITEGAKERIQVFNGTVIRRKGGGLQETFTVRRIVQGEGVERIFPLHSPNVADVVVKKRGRVRRAKLYYLRERVGKGVRVREKLWAKQDKAQPAEPEAPAESVVGEQAVEAPVAEAPAPAPKKAARGSTEKKKAEAERAGKKKAKKAKRKEGKQKKKSEPKSEK